MSVSLDVEETAQLIGVDEVSVDAHTEAERGVHFEKGMSAVVSPRLRGSIGRVP